jgi:Zn-dependent protease
VLYALRYPLSFAVLVVTFFAALAIRGYAQRLVSRRRQPAWVRANTRGRRTASWLKPFLDPYGCVAAALGGVGWGAPVDITDPRDRRGRRVAQLLVGPLVLAGIGVGLLAAFRAWSHIHRQPFGLLDVVHGSAWATSSSLHYLLPFGQVALFLAGVEFLAMGILALVPIPPLDGGKLLFALTPRRGGWQRARYRLDDENWGVLILLVIGLPVLVRRVLLVSLLGSMVDPLVRLVA